MRARLIALSLLAAAGPLSNASAYADIVRCNDASGNTLYTDSTCPAGTRAVSVTPFPQSCTTEDCERRRERDLKEADERVRAEKEQLAVFTAERHKREIEDRWLDEARYEAGLRSANAAQTVPDEVVYPAYPFFGIAPCGKRCLASPHQRRGPHSRTGRFDHAHGHAKSPVRGIGNVPRRPMHGAATSRIAPRGRSAIIE